MASRDPKSVGLNTICMLVLLMMSALFAPAKSDDQFLCCMRGIRSIRNIWFCPAPCCEGYEEKIVYPAKLARISYCVKVINYKADARREQF